MSGGILARQNQMCQRGVRVTSNPYYSRGKLSLTRSGAGPWTYTLAANTEVQFFGYGVGQDMGPAGLASVTATPADTNIQAPGQTVSGQTLKIERMGFLVNPCSDAEVARRVLSECSVTLSMNGGEQQLRLGTPLFWPGGGGLYGAGPSSIVEPDIQSPVATRGMISNGLPGYENIRPFPEGVLWMPDGNQDSNLKVLVKAERAVAFTLADRVAGDNPVMDLWGQIGVDGDGWSNATMGLDFHCFLVGSVISAPSQNL